MNVRGNEFGLAAVHAGVASRGAVSRNAYKGSRSSSHRIWGSSASGCCCLSSATTYPQDLESIQTEGVVFITAGGRTLRTLRAAPVHRPKHKINMPHIYNL